MARSHDGFTHTSRQFTTYLRTGTTPVVPTRDTQSGKCQPGSLAGWQHFVVYRKITTVNYSKETGFHSEQIAALYLFNVQSENWF